LMNSYSGQIERLKTNRLPGPDGRPERHIRLF
jgi:hypothetical protein